MGAEFGDSLMLINKDHFLEVYKTVFSYFHHKESTDNLNIALDSLQQYQDLFDSNVIRKQMAYVLASVRWESYDYKKDIYFGPLKEQRASQARQPKLYELQNRYWLSGYYGRGPIQLTWKNNYKLFEKLTGADLVNNPDLLLTDLRLGYQVTILGMTKGLFTGHKLSDYINSKECDYLNARKIVNGLDKAEEIKSYAVKLEICLDGSVT